MPEISRHELERPIGVSLAYAKQSLLPGEMLDHFLADWVMQYDALLRTGVEARTGPPFGDLSEQGWLWRKVDAIAGGLFQKRFNFYFAALFHISREISVTEAALEDCRTLQRPEALVASAENLVVEADERPRDRRGRALDFERAHRTIARLCDAAIARHEARLRLAREWKLIWQDEVKQCWKVVDEFEYRLKREGQRNRSGRFLEPSFPWATIKAGIPVWIGPTARLIGRCLRPSRLQKEMNRHGVHFKRCGGVHGQQRTRDDRGSDRSDRHP